MNDSPGRRRRWVGYAVRVTLGLGLLGLTVLSNREQIQGVWNRTPDLGLFSWAFTLYLSGVLLAYFRWYLLVRALEFPLRLLEAVRLGFIGTLFNLVIPGAVGGDFVKAAYFLRQHPTRKTQGAASVAIDRIIGLLGLFVLTLAVGAAGWTRLEGPLRRLVVIAGGLTFVVLMLLAVAFSPALFRGLVSRLSKRPKLAESLHELAMMGAAYRGRPAVLAASIVLALTTHILNVLAFHSVSRAIFPSVPDLATHFLIVPLVLFSTAIPLPFGALGVSENVSLGLFRLTRYDGGAIAMMGFRVLQYVGGLIALSVYLFSRREPVPKPDTLPRPHPVSRGGQPAETLAHR